MSLRLERILLVCGAIAGPLFVVAFLLEGATRAHYNALQHPVSSLALGEFGWTQAANFVVVGLATLAFAVGLRPALRRYGGRIWAPLLIGAFGLGLVGAGVFRTDPVSGYPPGTPMAPVQLTTLGFLHDAFSMLVFAGLPAACCVVGYRFARSGRAAWSAYSFLTAVVFVIGFFLASVGFSQDPTLMPVGGLLQRLTLVVGWCWVTALALHLLRRVPSSDRGGEPAGERAGGRTGKPTGKHAGGRPGVGDPL